MAKVLDTVKYKTAKYLMQYLMQYFAAKPPCSILSLAGGTTSLLLSRIVTGTTIGYKEYNAVQPTDWEIH
jgi:hypothetical protein